MTQVIVIHGGTTFAEYSDYLNYLRTKNISLDRLLPFSPWKQTLQQQLGHDYQVLLPAMPNKTNAKYEEWAIWFGRISEVMSDGCILVGHSLGGIFLAKYLSENKFPRRIKATILVAAPFKYETTESLGDFRLDGLTDLFREQAGQVTIFSGNDDPVVPAHEADRYQKELPSADIRRVSAPDHFVRTDFPELVELLKEL